MNLTRRRIGRQLLIFSFLSRTVFSLKKNLFIRIRFPESCLLGYSACHPKKLQLVFAAYTFRMESERRIKPLLIPQLCIFPNLKNDRRISQRTLGILKIKLRLIHLSSLNKPALDSKVEGLGKPRAQIQGSVCLAIFFPDFSAF